MVSSGNLNQVGGVQSSTLLRSNSADLGSQEGAVAQQVTYTSVFLPNTSYNTNMLGGANSSLSGFQNENFVTVSESGPLPMIADHVAFNGIPSNHSNLVTPAQIDEQIENQRISQSSNNPLLLGHQQSQVHQLEPQRFQHQMQQFPTSHSDQHRFQSIQGVGVTGPSRLEPHSRNEPIGQYQQLQSARGRRVTGPAPHTLNNSTGVPQSQPMQNHNTLGTQHDQFGRGMGPHRFEHQHSDQVLLQQVLNLSNQSPQAALAQRNLLQQQSILQQQQQQHQMLNGPQQRPQQLQQQTLPIIHGGRPVYKPATCIRILSQYLSRQKHRPDDNNIEFWRKFVGDFFAPNAKKKWCLSHYKNDHPASGISLRNLWHCGLCNRHPGRGFEATFDVLPRLFKLEYDSGILEEFLYVDMPHEHQKSNGQIVLDYAKVTQKSVLQRVRVVREGQLRIIFSQELKICSWEFCAHQHEEFISRRQIWPQICLLREAAQNYQTNAQAASSSLSTPDLQSDCNALILSARHLAKLLEVPLVDDLGYTKRYVRGLQISEVVESMKDLIQFSVCTGLGPFESFLKFPRRRSSIPNEQHGEQMQVDEVDMNNSSQSVQVNIPQSQSSNMVPNVSNSNATMPIPTSATTTVVDQPYHNSTDAITNNPMNTSGTIPSSQMYTVGSSATTFTESQPTNNPSPFSFPTQALSNCLPQSCQNALPTNTQPENQMQQPSNNNSDPDPDDDDYHQSSVDRIIQEMRRQRNGAGNMASSSNVGEDGSVTNDTQNMNGVTQPIRNSQMESGMINNNGATTTGSEGLDNSVFNNVGDMDVFPENNSPSKMRKLSPSLLPQASDTNRGPTFEGNEDENDSNIFNIIGDLPESIV